MTEPAHTITVWSRPQLAGWSASGAGRLSGAVIGGGAHENALAAALRACLAHRPRPVTIAGPAELAEAVDRLRQTNMVDTPLAGQLAEIDLDGVIVLPAEADATARRQAALAALALFGSSMDQALRVALRRSDRHTPAERARIVASMLGRQLLADAFGLKIQAIHAWTRRGIAHEYVAGLAELTGVPASLIRPAE